MNTFSKLALLSVFALASYAESNEYSISASSAGEVRLEKNIDAGQMGLSFQYTENTSRVDNSSIYNPGSKTKTSNTRIGFFYRFHHQRFNKLIPFTEFALRYGHINGSTETDDAIILTPDGGISYFRLGSKQDASGHELIYGVYEGVALELIKRFVIDAKVGISYADSQLTTSGDRSDVKTHTRDFSIPSAAITLHYYW